MRCNLLLLLNALLLTACTVVPTRPAPSSYGCMLAARAQVPQDVGDKQQHCVASALIAQQCSVSEAYFAGVGKELRDLFGSGDAEWADWQADRAGVRCARSYANVQDIGTCCAAQGF